MLTEREMDVAQVEAEAIVDDLYEEWLREYLGERAQRVEDALNANLRGQEPGAGAGGQAPAGAAPTY